jgi:hypothetical protein
LVLFSNMREWVASEVLVLQYIYCSLGIISSKCGRATSHG